MTSRTHDLFAFVSLTTVAVYNPPLQINTLTIIIASVGCIIGALLPDIDQESNRLWDFLPIGNFFGHFLRYLFLAHRTISHSILGIYLLFQLLNWILPLLLNSGFINVQVVIWSIMIGAISHLLLDTFTSEGIPLFFPIKLKIGFPPIKSLRIRTGSWVEKYVVFPGILVFFIWFIVNNETKLMMLFKLTTK